MNNLMSSYFSNDTQKAATAEPIAKASNGDGSSGETTNAAADKNSFTYDEGTGVKSIVKLTGPLSEVYTRMLNQSLAKKDPLEGEVESNEGAPTVGTESQQTENRIVEQAIATVIGNDAQRDAVNANYNFVDDRQFTDSVDVVAHMVNATVALKPETVYELSNASEEAKKKTLLVVVADPAGITQGMRLNKKFVQLDDDCGVEKVFGDDVVIATEALYKPFGVRVVFGIEGLLEAVLETK